MRFISKGSEYPGEEIETVRRTRLHLPETSKTCRSFSQRPAAFAASAAAPTAPFKTVNASAKPAPFKPAASKPAPFQAASRQTQQPFKRRLQQRHSKSCSKGCSEKHCNSGSSTRFYDPWVRLWKIGLSLEAGAEAEPKHEQFFVSSMTGPMV